MPDETSTLRISATLPKGGDMQVTRDGGPSLLPGGDVEVTHASALAWLNETLPEALSAFRAQVGIPDPVDEEAARCDALTKTLQLIRDQIPPDSTSLLDTHVAVRNYVTKVRGMRKAIDRTMQVARESIRPEADFSSLEDSALPGNVAEALQRANHRPVLPMEVFEVLGIHPYHVPPHDVAMVLKQAIATRVATEASATQRGTIGSLLDAAGLGSTAVPLGRAMELMANLRRTIDQHQALLTALGISSGADVVAQLSDRMRRIEDDAAMKARIKLLAVAGLPQPSAMSDERAAEALRSALVAQARRGSAEATSKLLDAAGADYFAAPDLDKAAELIRKRTQTPVPPVGTYSDGVDDAIKTMTEAAGLSGFDADGSVAERLLAAWEALRAKVRGMGVAADSTIQRMTQEIGDIRRVVKAPMGAGTAEYLGKTLADLRRSADNRDLLAAFMHAWINAFDLPRTLHTDVDSEDPATARRSIVRLDQAIRNMIAANGELGAKTEGRDADLTGFVVQLLAMVRDTPGAPDVPESLERGIREGGSITRAGALATLAGLIRQALTGSGEDAARLALRTIASVLRLPQDAAPALVAEKFSDRTEAWLNDGTALDEATDALNELRDFLVAFTGAEKLESVEDYSDTDIVRITERALLAERWPVGTPVEVRHDSGEWMSGHIGAIEVFEDDGNPIGIMPFDDDEPLWFPAYTEIVRASAAQARRMAGQEDEAKQSPPVEVKELLDEVGERLAMHAEKLFGSISKAFDQWPGGKR